ncbi:unnamed protein product [Linum tenue]|uniref:DUF7054 domain-containing protein n=1 Tax=Linum tenue TaxID=586396 RepID=A0AAV0MYX6_9ROSI|nr:unnamed protein product [Linum tenue]
MAGCGGNKENEKDAIVEKEKKKKKKESSSSSREFLVRVNVAGSTGPVILVVKQNDSVAAVIRSALKAYAKQGRVPALGSQAAAFILYSAATPQSDFTGTPYMIDILLFRFMSV